MFKTSRIIVYFWNVIAFFYHWQVMGFPRDTAIFLQVAALITELFLAGWYQSSLLWINRKIDIVAQRTNKFSKLIHYILSGALYIPRYIFALILYIIFYLLPYYGRLKLFEIKTVATAVENLWFRVLGGHLDLYLHTQIMNSSIRNMIIFTLIAPVVMAMIIILRRKWLEKHSKK